MTPIRIVLLGLILSASAAAHEGPPYPILVDESVAGVTLSVWTDPDVGEGTFYYYVDGECEGLTIELVSSPHEVKGLDTTTASQGPLRSISTPAPPGASYQLIGSLPFSHRGTWRTHFIVERNGVRDELSFDLDVTPPGLGLISLIWYAVPFLAIAAIWLRILFARQTYATRTGSGAESSSAEDRALEYTS